jgi:hypothetical protein
MVYFLTYIENCVEAQKRRAELESFFSYFLKVYFFTNSWFIIK